MPPKRKVPARRASSGKTAPNGDSPVIPISPSGRSRRKSALEINYRLARTRSPNLPHVRKNLAKSTKDGKDSAVARVQAEPSMPPKKRGRPPKSATGATASSIAKTTPVAPTAKAGRGRPKATTTAATTVPQAPKRKRDEEEPIAAPPKKRGRPSKADTALVQAKKKPATKVKKEDIKPKAIATKTKAGIKPNAVAKAAATPPAKRGRPLGSTSKTTTTNTTKSAKAPAKNATKAQKSPKATAKGVNSKVIRKKVETAAEDFDEGLTEPEHEEAHDSDMQYWLMKAEPNARIEKDVDISFSIDKLAAATEPEAWDGVRNFVARNNMRAMRKGDLAFFYHSNCDVPGIVGVMRVVEEHARDESAFDSAHPYYDEKSTDYEKPRWECVKVEFVKKFSNIITLKELKNTTQLSDMQIASKSYSRLSVQKVTPAQWRFVLKMANESEDVGVEPVVPVVSGYEADTNGETDKEAAEDSVGIDDVDAAKLAAYGSPDNLMDDEEADDEIAGAAQIEGELRHNINGSPRIDRPQSIDRTRVSEKLDESDLDERI